MDTFQDFFVLEYVEESWVECGGGGINRVSGWVSVVCYWLLRNHFGITRMHGGGSFPWSWIPNG